MLLPFCFAFTQMSVPTLLPAFDREFGASATWSSWTFSVFMLFAAVSLPLLGRLADQYGRRRLLLVSAALFVAGSLGCAAAPGLPALIACRAAQGVAAAFIALIVTLLSDVLPARRQSMATGALITAMGLGNVTATAVAPLLASAVSWRLIFALGALVAASAFVLIRRWVPEAGARVPARFDAAGATLLAVAIASLMLGLTEGGSWGWTAPPTLLLFAGALAAGTAWTVVELHVAQPMIELRMLAQRSIALTNAASVGLGFATFASITIVSRLAATPYGVSDDVAATIHHGFGAPTEQLGLYLLPGCVAGTLGGLTLGRVAGRVGWKWPLVAGAAIIAGGLGTLAVWHAAPWQVIAVMTIVGVPNIATATTTTRLVADAVGSAQRGVATTMNGVAFQAGGAIGVQVIAAILTGSVVAGTSVPTDVAFAGAFAAAAAAAALAIPLALVIPGARRRAARAAAPELAPVSP